MHSVSQSQQIVRIAVLRHASGLLLGTSPDLPGFTHSAMSAEQFEAEIDWAVKDMLQASGRLGVKVERIDHISPENGFGLRSLHARVECEAP